MFLATVNPARQLLVLSFIGEVGAKELSGRQEEMEMLMTNLQSGFRLMTDWSHMNAITPECAAEIGKIMELADQKGVGFVVRVIPDPSKDIGLNILSRFHYSRKIRTVACANMIEAAELLSL